MEPKFREALSEYIQMPCHRPRRDANATQGRIYASNVAARCRISRTAGDHDSRRALFPPLLMTPLTAAIRMRILDILQLSQDARGLGARSVAAKVFPGGRTTAVEPGQAPVSVRSTELLSWRDNVALR